MVSQGLRSKRLSASLPMHTPSAPIRQLHKEHLLTERDLDSGACFENLIANNHWRGFCSVTGLLLGNLRGTPAHANNYLPATPEFSSSQIQSKDSYSYCRRAARQSYGTSPFGLACQILLFALVITTWLPRRGAKIRCTSQGSCDQIWKYIWSNTLQTHIYIYTHTMNETQLQVIPTIYYYYVTTSILRVFTFQCLIRLDSPNDVTKISFWLTCTSPT